MAADSSNLPLTASLAVLVALILTALQLALLYYCSRRTPAAASTKETVVIVDEKTDLREPPLLILFPGSVDERDLRLAAIGEKEEEREAEVAEKDHDKVISGKGSFLEAASPV